MKLQSGFSLLESIIVIVIIGILYSTGLTYYGQKVDHSRRVGIEAQASHFTAAIAGIHAQWLIARPKGGIASVDVDGVTVYLNYRGWPTHTSPQWTESVSGQPLSSAVRVQKSAQQTLAQKPDDSAQHCYQLWNVLLQNPAPVSVEGNQAWGAYDYHISSPSQRICRYELAIAPRGSHFYDYILDTGQIFVTVPPKN